MKINLKVLAVTLIALFATISSTIATAKDWIIAGQSNSVALGGIVANQVHFDLGETLPNATIWQFPTNIFKPLSFGVTTSTYHPSETVKRFGPEWGMAERNEERFPGEEIRIVKYGVNGSSVVEWSQWNPDNYDVNSFTTRLVREINESGIVGYCAGWIQGEADFNKDLTVVKPLVIKLFDRFRVAAKNPNMVIVWPLLSPLTNGTGTLYTNAYRAMQEEIAAEFPLTVKLINLDDLPKTDDVHYSATSLIVMGHRIHTKCESAQGVLLNLSSR